MEVLGEEERLGVRVACVTFAPPTLLGAFARELEMDTARLFTDEERRAYAAFGFARGSVARVWLDPRVWRRYATLVGRGRRARTPAQDTLQLGGDVLVDDAGRITWVHRSTGPDDRPSLAELRSLT